MKKEIWNSGARKCNLFNLNSYNHCTPIHNTMKDQHTYTDKASYADQDVRWLLALDGQNVQVFCDGESRMYSIPEPVTEMKVEDNYVFIYVEGNKYYQFKFEFDMFLVADIFTNDGEHLDSFACHVFGEDV